MWNSARWAPTVHTAGGHRPPRQGGVGSPILPSGPNFPEVPPQPCVPAPSPKCRRPSGQTGWPRPLQHASPPAPSSPSSLSSASPISAGPTPQNLPVWEDPCPGRVSGTPWALAGTGLRSRGHPRPPEAALSLASPGSPRPRWRSPSRQRALRGSALPAPESNGPVPVISPCMGVRGAAGWALQSGQGQACHPPRASSLRRCRPPLPRPPCRKPSTTAPRPAAAQRVPQGSGGPAGAVGVGGLPRSRSVSPQGSAPNPRLRKPSDQPSGHSQVTESSGSTPESCPELSDEEEEEEDGDFVPGETCGRPLWTREAGWGRGRGRAPSLHLGRGARRGAGLASLVCDSSGLRPLCPLTSGSACLPVWPPWASQRLAEPGSSLRGRHHLPPVPGAAGRRAVAPGPHPPILTSPRSFHASPTPLGCESPCPRCGKEARRLQALHEAILSIREAQEELHRWAALGGPARGGGG